MLDASHCGETMPGKVFLAVSCSLLWAVGAAAQEAPKEKKALKNADIVLMVQNHLDDETLVKVIEASETDFDISGDELIRMKNGGVSSTVLRAMLQATQRKRRAAEAASPAASSSATGTNGVAPNVNVLSAASSSPAPNTPTGEAQAAPSPANGAGSPSPLASALPSAGNSMAGTRGMMDPQQMAAMQSQFGSMGPAMGMMGMPSMSMSYSTAQMPHVYLKGEVNKGKVEVSPSMAQIAQSKFNGGGPSESGMLLRMLANQALSFAALSAGPGGMMAMSAFSIGSGFLPGMRPHAPSMTYVWGLPGRKSSRDLGSTTPIFELSYGEIPGVDPDGYEPAVVKLVPTKDNYRLVGATRTKMGMNMMSGGGMEQGKWLSEERWPVQLSKEERGFYVLRVDQALEPGEYAVVLRPVKGYKPTSSGFGGGAQVFYSVWDFSVPGAQESPTDKKTKKK